MKRTLLTLLAISFSLLLAGCGAKPRSTAESFYTSIAKGNITEAKKYCTEQTGKMLDLVSSMGKPPVDASKKFIFDHEEIKGDNATVFFREQDKGSVEKMDLLKVDGKWKVNITK